MLVLLEPRSNESGCRFGLGDGLIMQDTTGKTYQPGGQLEGGGSFSLVQGQQQRLVATYAFIPSAGSTYTLHPSAINCDHHSIGYTPTYGDTPFTF